MSTTTSTTMNGNLSDTKLLALVDEGMSQAQIARDHGMSRQAVHKRLRNLRGRTTKVIIAKDAQKAVEKGFDALEQLTQINQKSLELLDEAEESPEFALKCIGELRNQIRLAMEIELQLFSVQEAERFMRIVRDILREVTPDAYKEFRDRINNERSLRQALRIA